MAETLAPRKPRRSERNNTSQAVSDIATSHYPVDDQAVYCINDKEMSPEDMAYQEKTFEMMMEAGVDPVWMSAEKCMGEEPSDSFFILPTFKGRVFDYLHKAKAKVLSTALVRQCLNEARSLPKWNHPVASLNLTNAKVCFTGMPLEYREKLSEMVWWMNGEVMRDLQPSVTHLITEKCVAESDKYRACRNRKIRVMLPSWVEDAWKEAGQRNYRDFLTEEMVAKYKTPIFKNLVICTTGVIGQERVDAMRLIELHGGRSPGEMKRGECTHLVTEGVVGNKYRKAREWRTVHIVNLRWIRKSVEMGYLQDEKRFDPENATAAKSSTQTPEAVAPVDLDMSSIYAVLKNHTVNSQFGGNLNGSHVGNPAEKVPQTPVTMPRVASRRRLSPGREEDPSKTDVLDKLLDTTLKGDFDFFEGWYIYICGLDRSRLDKLNKILDRCGATRVTALDQATHIVVVNAGSERGAISKIQREERAEVVRMEWLTDCVEKKEMIGTAAYIWDPEAPTASQSRSTSVVNATDRPVSQIPGNSKTVSSGATNNSTISTTLTNAGNIATDRQALNSNGLVFSGLSFRLDRLESQEVVLLEPKIIGAGGLILTEADDQLADYMVSNFIELGAAPSRTSHKYVNLVTENYVEFCLDQRRVAGPKERPLFRPIPAVSGSQVFLGVVIGFMGLYKVDKENLRALVERFGGRVEGSIVTTPKNGMLPCTHLVVGEQNAKLEGCKKKLPHLKIVDPSWILECIINDSMLLELRFPFTGTVFGDYQRTDDMWEDQESSGENVAEEEGNGGNITVHMEELDEPVPLEEEMGQEKHQENMDFTLNGPVDFGRCTTSTPIGARSAVRPRRSTSDPMRFNPRLVLDGISEFIDQMPSPSGTEADVSSSFNASEIGRMLAAAAIRTGHPTPRRSVTEPVTGSRQKTTQRQSGATPRIAVPVVKEEKPLAPPPSRDTSTHQSTGQLEVVKTMMIEQLRRMEEMRRREEEDASRRTQDTSRTSRKRAPHELLEDSPAAAPPAAKRNQSQMAIGWNFGETEDRDDSVVQIVEKRVSSGNAGNRKAVEPSVSRQPSAINEVGPPRQPITVGVVGGTWSTDESIKEMPQNETDNLISIPASPLRCSTRLSGSRRSATPLPPPTEPTPEPLKVFLFSGLSSSDKAALPQMAIRLGGRVIETDVAEVDDDVTHLITGKMVRGTKLMGCIASGRWVLTPEFIKESTAAGHWLPEEDFEWANPSIVAAKGVKGRELEIANAARRWRREERTGAFEGWRVLLYATSEKAKGVGPLLTAGRAKVFVREKTTVEEARPTHVIVVRAKEWGIPELEKVVSMGAKVFGLDYISHMLLDESVREEDFYHTDYKVLRRRMHNP